jgi:hypothetical protein
MIDTDRFITLAERLVTEPLRQAVGYSVGERIPIYRGIVGFMVETPLLWIRRSRFPILVIAYDRQRPPVLDDVVHQLEVARASEFFALLIVVPTRDGDGTEADELRAIVDDSIYSHDFVVLDRHHLASLIASNSSQRLVEIIVDQGISRASLSPYVVVGPVPDNMFFGRENEIKAVSQTIARGDHAIVGGRRMGKSSMLQKLCRLLNGDPRYQAWYLNLESQFSYEDFFSVLSDDFDLSFRSSDPLEFRRLVARLRSDASESQLVFLLDEVDALMEIDAEAVQAGKLFKVFRALSHEQACRFVFSGSEAVYRKLHDARSPLFNFCSSMVLKPLAPESVAQIVERPMSQLGLELARPEEIVRRMVELTSCHPSLVQWLCDRLVQTVSGRQVRLTDLNAAAATPDFGGHFVDTAWGSTTPLQRLVSLLPERTEFELDEVLKLAAAYDIGSLATRDALDMLEMNAMIERCGNRYRFVLTDFPRVIRERDDVPALLEDLRSRLGA